MTIIGIKDMRVAAMPANVFAAAIIESQTPMNGPTNAPPNVSWSARLFFVAFPTSGSFPNRDDDPDGDRAYEHAYQRGW